MLLFRKVFLTLILVVFAGSVSGCVVAVPLIAAGQIEANTFSGVVEVGDIRANGKVNVASIKGAMVSSAVFNKDMTKPNENPRSGDVKMSAVIAEEVKHTIGVYVDPSKVTIRLKVYYDNTYPLDWYYRSVTEKGTLGLFQSAGIRKLVNAHLLLEQDGNTLLEVRGLWVAGNPGDEIAGARQLAREMANAVLKKLNSPASRKASVAEAKKD